MLKYLQNTHVWVLAYLHLFWPIFWNFFGLLLDGSHIIYYGMIWYYLLQVYLNCFFCIWYSLPKPPPPPLSTIMKTFNQKPFFWNTALHKKGLSFRNLKKGLGKINCFKKGGITYFHSHYPFPVLSFSECFACVWVLCLFAPFYQYHLFCRKNLVL